MISTTNLTDDDMDVLSGMMVIFFHAAERCINIMENEYALRYHASNEYKQAVRQYGKAAVDAKVKEEAIKMVRGDEKLQLGRLLDAFRKVKMQMERISERATIAHVKEVSDAESLSALIHDANSLCKAYGYMCNIRDDKGEVQFWSMLKLMAKADKVSPQVMEKFNDNIS